MGTRDVVAVTNVTYDGHRYQPGSRFALPRLSAHALAAAGHVRILDDPDPDRPPDDLEEKGGAHDPADVRADPDRPPVQTSAPSARGEPADRDASRPPARHTMGAAGPPAAPAPPPDPAAVADLEHVSGIGPSTAARLREAGVDLEALAAMTDARAAELRVRDSWREQARMLTGAAALPARTELIEEE